MTTTRNRDDDPLIVLATFGTLGDLRPFVLMATLLRDRGHRVMLVAPAFHEARLIDSGLPYRPYGTVELAELVLADPDLWHHRKGIGVLLRSLLPCIAAVSEIVAELAATQHCVLLCHAVLLPVADLVRANIRRSAARDDPTGELPTVGVWLAPSNLRTCEDPLTIGALSIPRWMPMAARRWLWRFIDRVGVDPGILPGLNALRASVGLLPIRRFAAHLQGTCDASIGLFPAWFGPRRLGWPEAFVDGDFPLPPVDRASPLSTALERFLDAGTPPIVFTAGTGMRQADRFFAQAQVALQRTKRRGVFVTSHAAQLPNPLAPGVHAEPFVDFARLLPAAAAIVHHGGIGTTAESLRAGVPQLITPFGFDQFDNAARIRALGVGDALPASRVNARRLRRALEPLLTSPSVAADCRAVAERFAGRDLASSVIDKVEAAIERACQRRAAA